METPTPSGETPEERIDRELAELLDELRVLLPGVQLVFGFLLAAPFAAAFEDVTNTEQVAYVIAFAGAALASVLLIAPVAHHRARFRQGDKEALLRQANVLMILAMVTLGIALAAASYLVFSFVVAAWAGALAAALVAALAVWLWFGRVAARPTLADRRSLR